MSKRAFWILCSMLSLSAGAVLYGVFRQDTYIGKVFDFFSDFSFVGGWLYAFVAFYLPDYLWMFSLTCALFATMLPCGKNLFFWSCVAFLFGAFWELLQLCHIVSGTADIHDVILYSLAAFSAAIIKILRKEEIK